MHRKCALEQNWRQACWATARRFSSQASLVEWARWRRQWLLVLQKMLNQWGLPSLHACDNDAVCQKKVLARDKAACAFQNVLDHTSLHFEGR